jgi:hypothetical protein
MVYHVAAEFVWTSKTLINGNKKYYIGLFQSWHSTLEAKDQSEEAIAN